MEKKIKIFLLTAVIVIGGFLVFNASLTGLVSSSNPNQESGEFDEFAKCLSSKGIKMAGAEWCSACQKQKKLFGSSFSFIDFKDCDQQAKWCKERQIKYYPTWFFPNGKKIVGVQSMEELSELSGCEI